MARIITVKALLTKIYEDLKDQPYLKVEDTTFLNSVTGCSNAADLIDGCGGFNILDTIADRLTWRDWFRDYDYTVGVYRGNNFILFLKEEI